MNPELRLSFKGGFLRPLVETDVHQGYVDGLNDPDVNQYLDASKASVQTMASVSDFVVSNRLSSTAVLWGLWMHESVWHIGTVRVHGIEFRHGTANIGVCIFDKRFWGKGIGSNAIKAVTAWAIDGLNLRWIEAGAFEDNLASQRTFLSAGYEWVFDIPDKYLLEGMPTNVKVYARRSSRV